MARSVLLVQVNVLGRHAEFDDADDQPSQPYREEFEDVNNVLRVKQLPCFTEPEHVLELDSTDLARQWDDRLSAESLMRLRCAYASMQVVCAPLRPAVHTSLRSRSPQLVDSAGLPGQLRTRVNSLYSQFTGEPRFQRAHREL